MTDHNADAGKMVEACGWCGALPDLEQYGEYFPSPCGHFGLVSGWIHLSAWNDIQSEVMEMRRRDFDAGYALAAEHEGNQTEIDYDSFESYLASTRK